MMVLSSLNAVTVMAEPDYEDENYWSEKCTVGSIGNADDYAACEAYRDYMASHSASLSDKLAEIERERELIAKDLAKYSQQLNDYQEQADAINAEINVINAGIAENEAKVAELEKEEEKTLKEIDALQKEVDELGNKVLDRMVSAQWTMRLNTFLEILIGARTFQDLMRIINGMNSIVGYEQKTNQKLVESAGKLNEAKQKLEEDQQQLQESRKQLQEEKDVLTEKRNDVLVARYKVQVIEEEYEKQAAAVEAEGNKYAEDIREILSMINGLEDQLDNIPDTVLNPTPEPTPTPTPTPTPEPEPENKDPEPETPEAAPEPTPEPTPVPETKPEPPSITTSSGWVYPVPGAYRSAGTWAYPGGGAHLGYDFANKIGSPIYAVGNGVVLYSADSCDTYGYLGSSCGYPGSTGGGNQVYLLTKINGYLYALKYLHMQSGTPISRGTIVSAGDQIGRVGTSGNSSGPHCHIEIFYLGSADNFTSYAKNWDGDLAFGAGWAGYDRKCDAGYGAPCRIRPESIFGY